MQRSKGTMVGRRNLQSVRVEHRTEEDILPIASIHMRTEHTNQGIRIPLVRMGLLHCEVVEELTKHRIVVQIINPKIKLSRRTSCGQNP